MASSDENSDPEEDTTFSGAYQVLHQLAHVRLRTSRRDGILDTTALVHESFLRVGELGLEFRDRGGFLAYASRVMRSIIIDHARQRQAERYGGKVQHVTFTLRHLDGGMTGEEEILRVHEALSELARVDERMARIVEMRYFGGLTEAEIASALGVSDRTVRRDWQQARVFLADALQQT